MEIEENKLILREEEEEAIILLVILVISAIIMEGIFIIYVKGRNLWALFVFVDES